MNLQTAAATQAKPTATTDTSPASATRQKKKCKCASHSSSHATCLACAAQAKAFQRKPYGAIPNLPLASIVDEVLATRGRPMDERTRAFMQDRFAHDFTQVRLHSDAQAAQSARAIQAHAYTVGNHIVLGRQDFDPATPAGAGLLAHELTHVVQVSRYQDARCRTSFNDEPEPLLSDPSQAAETEAESASRQALRGESVRVRESPGAGINRLSTGAAIGIGAAAGVTGLGIAWLAGAFDRENFSDDELRAYLTVLATTHHIEDNRDSDNKARDVVRKWAGGKSPFDLNLGFTAGTATLSSIDLKRLLILEMLSGVTASDDETAIITIIERTDAQDLYRLLDPQLGVSIQRLDDKIGGDNHRRLEAVLEHKYPDRQPSAARTQTDTPSCSARQGLMLMYARRDAEAMVTNAIEKLSENPDDPPVRRALDCRFNGAKPAHIQRILSVLQRTAVQLTTRMYVCGSDLMETAQLYGQELNCVAEDADSFIDRSTGQAKPGVYLCPVFFQRTPEIQAITVVHESVHAAGVSEDPAYQPACGLALDTALRNPDSFAYFVADVKNPGGSAPASTPLPSVSVGNFRNSGALTPENQCPVCPDLPGLGPDPNTGLNIMEVRGDISGNGQGIEYDFRRTKERAIWRGSQGEWKLLRYEPPGTDDDRTNRDEQLAPQNNHIYSVDGPGLPDLNAPLGPNSKDADQAVFKGSFVEYVQASVSGGAWSIVSNNLPWHSITWLEKDDTGVWTRKQGANELEQGAIPIGRTPPA
jgi:hypothetical protein